MRAFHYLNLWLVCGLWWMDNAVMWAVSRFSQPLRRLILIPSYKVSDLEGPLILIPLR